MGETLLWVGLWSMTLWVIGMLRGDLCVRRSAKVLFFPGFLLEATLRSIACLLTATPIQRSQRFALAISPGPLRTAES